MLQIFDTFMLYLFVYFFLFPAPVKFPVLKLSTLRDAAFLWNF